MTIDPNGLLAEVRANLAKLDGCNRHFFEPIPRRPLAGFSMPWRRP